MIEEKAAKTGGLAGVTRGISTEIRISRNPSIFIFDTPGVFVPHVKDETTMIALAITGAMRTSIIDPIIQADYLLYRLNIQSPDGKLYQKYLPEPTNNIRKLLKAIWAKELKPKQRKSALSSSIGGGVNEAGAAALWVDRWRQGHEGKVMLDDIGVDDYLKVKDIQEKMLDRFDMDFDLEAKKWKKPTSF